MIRHLGITVLPEYIQSEGPEAVIDHLVGELGATAVNTSPYVARSCPPGEGHREPPPDAGAGDVRLLDRPLWGKREVWMATAPSFVPDLENYEGSAYLPNAPTPLTEAEGPRLARFLELAKARGLQTSLQIMAAIPPCYRVQFGDPHAADQPLMPNGEPVPVRVDRNASLASPDLRRYMRGLITDLCRIYPEVHALRFDWPEYPPYHFQSLLADYNPAARPFAEAIGIDFDALRCAAEQRDYLARALARAMVGDVAFDKALAALRRSDATVDDHFRLREHLVVGYAHFLMGCVEEASGGAANCIFQGFPPPWNAVSGFSALAASRPAAQLAIKFYTMHWPMIGANYSIHLQQLLDMAADAADAAVRRTVLDLPRDSGLSLVYPAPQKTHGFDAAVISSKMARAGARITGISHSYGPVEDVVARFAALFDATGGNIEINRYAYLSDEKISALGSFIRSRLSDGARNQAEQGAANAASRL